MAHLSTPLKLVMELTVFAVALAVPFRCAPPRDDVLARVGSTTITQADADAFERVVEFMSDFYDESGLCTRNRVDALLCTQALFDPYQASAHTRAFKQSREWRWRRTALLSHLYSREALQKLLGQPEQEVRRYYETHKNEFAKLTLRDSGGVTCTTRVIPPFDSVKGMAAEKLFFSTYTPDSASFDLYHRRTFKFFRESGYREHFMKKFYREKFGTPLPDSIELVVGMPGCPDTTDIALFRSWFRGPEHDWLDSSPRSLITMGLRYALFADKAESSGFTTRKDVSLILSWAWKFEAARNHIGTIMLPLAATAARFDTAMARYSYWDDTATVPGRIDSVSFAAHLNTLDALAKKDALDRLLFAERTRAKVRFLQQVWIDRKARPPRELAATADSLRDALATGFAEECYSILAEEFPFTPEGKNALVELARIQTAGASYHAAIRNYRRRLLMGASDETPVLMFTIGFIYDQYLGMPDRAEINYAWVLKHAPQSNVAADAEVMLQHLGEPMPGVEELQAEAARQGRSIAAKEHIRP